MQSKVVTYGQIYMYIRNRCLVSLLLSLLLRPSSVLLAPPVRRFKPSTPSFTALFGDRSSSSSDLSCAQPSSPSPPLLVNPVQLTEISEFQFDFLNLRLVGWLILSSSLSSSVFRKSKSLIERIRPSLS